MKSMFTIFSHTYPGLDCYIKLSLCCLQIQIHDDRLRRSQITQQVKIHSDGTTRVLCNYCMRGNCCHNRARDFSQYRLRWSSSQSVLRSMRTTWPVREIWMCRHNACAKRCFNFRNGNGIVSQSTMIEWVNK